MQFTGCSGGTPVPSAGVYVAKGIVHGPAANACTSWFVPPLGTPPIVNFNAAHLDGVVNWSPSAISPSNVSFARLRIYTGAGGHLFIRLPAAASLVSGSYVRHGQPRTPGGPDLRHQLSLGRAERPEHRPGEPRRSFSAGTW